MDINTWSKNNNASTLLLQFEGFADQSPAALVAACDRGDTLIGIAVLLGYSVEELSAAVRPIVLRALQVSAPPFLEAAGLHVQANALRALPKDVSWETLGNVVTYCRPTSWRMETGAPAQAVRYVYLLKQALTKLDESTTKAAVYAVSYAAALYAITKSEGDIEAAWEEEYARCADDIREALPDLAERWAAALASQQQC